MVDGTGQPDWHVCPTLTPLYHAGRAWAGLSADRRRRYNAAAAESFVDLVLFFEQAFAAALATLLADGRLGPDLAAAVGRFADDERRHVRMWHHLRAGGGPTVVRVGWPLRWAVGRLARRPRRWPVVVLVMLTLEEHSIEISRRCGRMDPATIDPAYAAAFRDHLLDEARHVRVDHDLLAHLLAGLSPPLTRANAALFRLFLRHLWLRPARAAVRVVDTVAEPADRGQLRRAVRAAGAVPAYRRMMCSPQSSPLLVGVLRHHRAFCPAELRDELEVR